MVNIRQFSIFFLVGLLNTSIDIGVFSLLKNQFQIANDSNYIILINAIAIALAMTFSFLANKYLTFEAKHKISAAEIIRFLTINGLSFLVNSTILIFILQTVPDRFLIDIAILGKIIATGGSMLVSFAGYKLFVFKP